MRRGAGEATAPLDLVWRCTRTCYGLPWVGLLPLPPISLVQPTTIYEHSKREQDTKDRDTLASRMVVRRRAARHSRDQRISF
jgi:hypothetical protein